MTDGERELPAPAAQAGGDATADAVRLALGMGSELVTQVVRTLDDVAGRTTGAATSGTPATPPPLVAVAVGALVEGRERVSHAATGVRQATEPFAPLVIGVVDRIPVLGSRRRAAARRLGELRERGERELASGTELAGQVVGHVTDRALGSPMVPGAVDRVSEDLLPQLLEAILPVAISELTRDPAVLSGVIDSVLPGVIDQLGDDPATLMPVIDAVLPAAMASIAEEPEALMGVVNAVIGPILPEVLDMLKDRPELIMGMIGPMLEPMIDEVLPVALGKLNEDPQVVRSLVLDQGTGMATEMANLMRSRTVTADDFAERVARRLTLRKPRKLALPPETPS